VPYVFLLKLILRYAVSYSVRFTFVTQDDEKEFQDFGRVLTSQPTAALPQLCAEGLSPSDVDLFDFRGYAAAFSQ